MGLNINKETIKNFLKAGWDNGIYFGRALIMTVFSYTLKFISMVWGMFRDLIGF